MAELRHDPLGGYSVVIADARALRPNEFAADPPVSRRDGECPFCAGNERLTTCELDAFREPGTPITGPGWRVRAVPNKYPALVENAARSGACGSQEVIVESPRHVARTTQLNEVEQAEVLAMYARRLRAHRADGRWRYGLVFKNVGPRAGASLEHAHSQLVVMPTIPDRVAASLARLEEHHRQHGRCGYCQRVEQELLSGERVVAETEAYVAFCPAAARFPGETWIVPRSHTGAFELTLPENPAELAALSLRVVEKIERVFPQACYNMVLHSSPFDTHEPNHYHWRMEFLPRLTTPAGFEWGTGWTINPLAPEQAAEQLRTD